MKKIVYLILSLSLVLFAFTPVQASIIWGDPVSDTYNYNVGNNGGDFYHPDAYPNPTNDYEHSWTNTTPVINEDKVDGVASDVRVDNFYGKGGSASLEVYASGSLTDSGTTNSVYSNINYAGGIGGEGVFAGGENGFKVKQVVVSNIVRTFSVESSTYANFDVSLDGLIDFDTIDGDAATASYSLDATAFIQQYVGGVLSEQATYSLDLSDENRSGSMNLQLFSEIDGAEVYYLMSTRVSVKTEVDSLAFNGIKLIYDDLGAPTGQHYIDWLPLELEGSFQLGEADNPLTLTTAVTPVSTPIPGSLILLLSGLGGLNVFRRFRFA